MSKPDGLPAGVEVISGDMDASFQGKLAELCLEGLRSTAVLKDVPKWIKTQADRLYSQLWHVVMVNGQFWCHFGHEPGHSFVFRHEKHIFIVWKTPQL